MAKKSRAEDSSGPTAAIPNRDLMQRMSFLYQASVCLQNASSRLPESAAAKPEMQRLARKHVKTIKSISNGTMVKIDPTVKRVLCKGCNTVLVPGSTASVRVKTSKPHGKIVSYTCFSCHAFRVIPAPPIVKAHDAPADPAAGPSSSSAATQVEVNPNAVARRARRSKARAQPFFARVDAGHVVFRGPERVGVDTDDQQAIRTG